jgi:hypothetical protein
MQRGGEELNKIRPRTWQEWEPPENVDRALGAYLHRNQPRWRAHDADKDIHTRQHVILKTAAPTWLSTAGLRLTIAKCHLLFEVATMKRQGKRLSRSSMRSQIRRNILNVLRGFCGHFRGFE